MRKILQILFVVSVLMTMRQARAETVLTLPRQMLQPGLRVRVMIPIASVTASCPTCASAPVQMPEPVVATVVKRPNKARAASVTTTKSDCRECKRRNSECQDQVVMALASVGRCEADRDAQATHLREMEESLNQLEQLDVARPDAEEPAPVAPSVSPARQGRGRRGGRASSAPAAPASADEAEDFAPIQIRGQLGSPQ